MSEDNASEAVGYAVAAVQRQPTGINGRILLAEAFAADPTTLSATQKREVLSLIEQVQQAQPGEPRTMALRISVLAGAGDRAAAGQAMREALAADPPLTQSAMVTLIAAAKRYDLDPNGETEAAYVQRFGQTLAITMVQAQRLVEAGDKDAALALFDAARPETANPEWDVNRALLLERLGRSDATASWSAAGAAYPDNLKVQQAQLGSAAAWQDRSAIKNAIKRMRTITGDDDPSWRIEQARWLLASEDPIAAAPEADGLLDAALKIEPEAAEALALRGRSQRLLGNPRLAVSLLSQAVTLSPNDADARAELALAQRDAGSAETALETARGAAAMEDASPQAQRRAAQLMIDDGEFTEAANVLARLERSGRADGRDLFTLAQLYRQTQQTSRAIALIESMLDEPTPSSIALAADLYAQADMAPQAAAALAQLDELELTDAQAGRIRAVHASSYGTSQEADAAWVALVQVAPGDADAWTQLVSYRLRDGRPADAVAAARQAAEQLPSDANFAAVVAQAELIERLADEPGAAALGLAILEEPEHRGSAINAMKVLDRARASGQSAEVLAEQLVSLAEASPGFESLWVLSVSHEFGVGRQAAALARAAAARDRFPDSPRSARLAAEAYAAAGQWREALLATEAWTSLLTGSRWEADTLAARAHRELGRSSASVAVLSPYAQSVRDEPTARPTLTKELTLAWAATGQVKSAKEVLEPLLDQDTRWRMAWLDAAVLCVPSTRQAGQWLDTLDAAMPAEAWAERGALAQAWWQLGMRDSYAPFREQGRAMAEALAQRPGASAGLWYFVGSAAELDGDLSAAESAYRQAIATDPAMAAASNNLAMLITDRNGDLGEAATLAEQAIAAEPYEPNYYDTLAYVLKQAGRLDEARTAIEKAIQLDPGNPAWRTRLNEMAVVAE
ncbi:MAG: tetratricopeptide repeat protein [Planctomycetota bacterium]